MDDDVIRVHPEVLRGCARDLAGTGYRLAHGLRGAPGLTLVAPEWVAAGALAALESAVDRYFGAVGAGAAQTAAGLRAAADEYEAVDDRVARRLTRRAMSRGRDD